MTRRAVAVTAIFASSILLGSCSSQPEAPAAADTTTTVPEAFTKLPSTTAVDKCGPQSGTTLEDGVLTIATDSPAYAPWFVDNDPSNGKGLEVRWPGRSSTSSGTTPTSFASPRSPSTTH
ncbi:hypothetical protein GCM10020255_101210 [Rhodococcus baikonurensis]